MCPLGKDRYYRRYWVFKSLPGVFVEDDDEDDGQFNRSYKGEYCQALKQENLVDGTSMMDLQSENDGKENKPDLNGNGQIINAPPRLSTNEMSTNKFNFFGKLNNNRNKKQLINLLTML
jgi:hypothetical protein